MWCLKILKPFFCRKRTLYKFQNKHYTLILCFTTSDNTKYERTWTQKVMIQRKSRLSTILRTIDLPTIRTQHCHNQLLNLFRKPTWFLDLSLTFICVRRGELLVMKLLLKESNKCNAVTASNNHLLHNSQSIEFNDTIYFAVRFLQCHNGTFRE